MSNLIVVRHYVFFFLYTEIKWCTLTFQEGVGLFYTPHYQGNVFSQSFRISNYAGQHNLLSVILNYFHIFQKNFDICFHVKLDWYYKKFICGREAGHQALSPVNFEIFLILPKIVRLKSFFPKHPCSYIHYLNLCNFIHIFFSIIAR